MSKVLNKATTMPLTQVQIKLDQHLQAMNADGWELMSIAPINVGIEEVFVMFWRKTIEVLTAPAGGTEPAISG